MDMYKLGFNDPEVKFDDGVGNWNSVAPSNDDMKRAEYFIIEVRRELINSWMSQFFAPDAVTNLEHYLENTGELLHFNEKAFMKSSYCKGLFDNEVCEAKNFCKKLKPGSHYKITSTYARLGDIPKHNKLSAYISGDLNIFYSLGGFRYWGKADVDIVLLDKDDILYSMDFTFILKDRYNWNLNDGVAINGTEWSDDKFGALNLYGYAHDFDIIGIYKHKYVWRKNEPPHPLTRPYPIRYPYYLEATNE